MSVIADLVADALTELVYRVVGDPLHRWRARKAARESGLSIHIRVPEPSGSLSSWRPAVLHRDDRGLVVETIKGEHRAFVLGATEMVAERRVEGPDRLRLETAILTHSKAGSIEFGFHDDEVLDEALDLLGLPPRRPTAD
jgi:hypothetical protein